MPQSYSAALPIAHALLRLLIVLNWLVFGATVVLLVAMPYRAWLVSALHLSPSAQTDRIVIGFEAIAVIGLCMVPLYHLILTRLLAIVRTVRAGDPFVADNASRLHAIAWTLIGLQVCGLVIAAIVRAISTVERPINIGAGPSIGGLLAILLAFILARVFAEGARMRDDLEGTV